MHDNFYVTFTILATSHSAVNCGNPGVPDNGAKHGGVYTYGSRVTFQCQPGFRLSGNGEILCEDTGTWDGPLAQCTGLTIG